MHGPHTANLHGLSPLYELIVSGRRPSDALSITSWHEQCMSFMLKVQLQLRKNFELGTVVQWSVKGGCGYEKRLIPRDASIFDLRCSVPCISSVRTKERP